MEQRKSQVKTYLTIWALLVVLTGATVFVARLNLGKASVLGALTIATVKAALVVLFFMHLLHEKRIFKVMFLMAISTLSVFIGMTFFDILSR